MSSPPKPPGKTGGRARAALLGTGLAFAAYDLSEWPGAFLRHPYDCDFRLYYAAARIGLGSGWSHLYDFTRQAQAVQAEGPGAGWTPYLNPPLMAWLATPFSLGPFAAGRYLFTAFMLACLVSAWWLARPVAGVDTAIRGLLTLGFFPVSFAVILGQPLPLLALALVGAVRLAERDRELAAGALLGLIWVKPQIAFLLPVGVIFARRWGMLTGLAMTGIPLGLLQTLSLGPAGLAEWRHALEVASTWQIGGTFSAGVALGGGPARYLVLLAAAAAIALVGVRHPCPRTILIAAPLASLLAAPYSSLQDLTILVAAGWLWLGAEPGHLRVATALLGWLLAELALVLGATPLLLFEAGWLGWLAIQGSGGRPGVVSIRVEAGTPGRTVELSSV